MTSSLPGPSVGSIQAQQGPLQCLLAERNTVLYMFRKLRSIVYRQSIEDVC